MHRDPLDHEDDPAYHSAGDVAANIDTAMAEQAGELVTAVALDWAKNPPHREKKAAAAARQPCKDDGCITE